MGQNLGSESGDLVPVFSPLMSRLSFVTVFPLLLKRFTWMYVEKIKKFSQDDALWI